MSLFAIGTIFVLIAIAGGIVGLAILLVASRNSDEDPTQEQVSYLDRKDGVSNAAAE